MESSDLGSKRSADVIIIGGGVIGLSIAHELALRGLSDVMLLERGEFAKEASWAAGGILAPQVEAEHDDDFFKFACASRDLYPEWAAVLHHNTGIDVELDRTGTLYLGFSSDGEIEMRRRFAWQTENGLAAEWLTAGEALRLEPNLSPNLRCATLFPNDWQIDNRKLLAALLRRNESLGVKLVANCEVETIQSKDGRATAVATNQGLIRASKVVMAAGAWCSQIKPPQLFANLVEPVRGQMLCFQPAQQLARHVVYSARGYLVPRRDGRLIAGSTAERVGFDKQVTDAGINAIKTTASEIAPAIAGLAVVDSWAGFRPRAADNLPVIGPSTDVKGLFYATGHYRNGILLAPATAKFMSAMVAGTSGQCPPWLESFSPDRLKRSPEGFTHLRADRHLELSAAV